MARAPGHQRGYVLVTVMVAAFLVAGIAFLVNHDSAVRTSVAAGELDVDAARYVAEAGLQHGLWRARQANCSSYADIIGAAFGNHSYSVTATPSDGSPIVLQATAMLDSGGRTTLTSASTRIYSAAALDVVTLQPGAAGIDTYIRDGANDSNNFGASGVLKFNNQSAEEASLLKFDLSGIPAGVVIESAVLELWLQGGQGLSNGTIDLHRVVQPWVEGTRDGSAPVPGTGATYNSYNGQSNWASFGGDYASPPVDSITIPTLNQDWYLWDLTSLVNDWLSGSFANDGVLLRASAGNVDKIWFASGDGSAGLHPKLTVSYSCECGQACALPGGSVDVPVSAASDDAEERVSSGFMYLDSSDLELAVDGSTSDTVGIRFAGVDVPAGATITDAYIQFQVDETDTGSADLTIAGHAVDNAPTFGGSAYDISSRTLTSATVSWAPPGWTTVGEHDADQRTPSITPVIQEIVGRPGWAGGNAIAVVISGTGTRTAESFDGDPAGAAILHVEYNGGSESAGENLLFVVGSTAGAGPTAAELSHQARLESWGYTVQLIDDGASQAAFDAAVLDSDVVFTTNDITANNLGTKLVDATIGVVTSEDNLSDEFGLASGIAWESGASVDIDDNSHYITSPFPTGALTILSSSRSLAYVTGTLAPDLDKLASSSSGFGIVALETGAAMSGGGNAAGRRVQLPWGGSDFHPDHLNTAGETLLQRALEWAAGAGNDAALAPIAHWKLDDAGGTTAVDSVGSNHGTLVGGPAWAAGQIDGSLQFDGINDYIDVSTMNPVAYDNFTVSAWYKSADSGVSDDEYIYEHNDNYAYEITFGPTDDGTDDRLRFGFANGGSGTWDPHYGTSDIVDQEWHHVVGVRSDGRIKIYVDGVEESDGVDAHAGQTITIDGDGPFIGDLPGDTEQVHGSLDDVRLYDRALSAAEILDLFSAGEAGAGGGGTSCDGNFRDEFNVESYGNNDGSLNWSTDWLEVNESDGWDSGDEQVVDDDSDFHLRIRDNDSGGEGIQREADLSGSSAATLSFRYRRDGFDKTSDYVMLHVSPDGGGSWTELDVFEGPATDSAYISASYNVSSFTSANTRVRFLTSSGLGGGDEFFVDDVEISCTP